MKSFSIWSFLLSAVSVFLLLGCVFFGSKRPSQPDGVFEALVVIVLFLASAFIGLTALTVAIIGRIKSHRLSSLAILVSVLVLVVHVGALFF